VARLRTKHVVRVTDVDATDEGLPYIVMEFLEGRDLDAELQARTRLPLAEAIDIVLQACSGMLEAHGMGIVHRDLKPANLFLTSDDEGTERIVKVLDFGISKMVGEVTRLTSAGAVMGTVLYMSPEQVSADSNVDMRADIWSLGVILFELLAGRAPFEGAPQQIAAKIMSEEPPDLRSFAQVPEGVAFAVRRMLERDRARRFSSMAEVVSALSPFAAQGSIGAGIAAKLALGGTGSRGRTAQLNAKRTVPMLGTPGFVDRSSPSEARRSDPLVAQRTPASLSRNEPPPPPAPRSRFLLVLAIMVGLLGSAGAVLTLVALFHRTKVVDGPDAAEASAAIAPAHPSALAVTESSAIVGAPPSTGTSGHATASTGTTSSSGRPSAPATSSSARKDGGASRPPAPGIPTVL
jgi:serine/threonine-protein kinase